MFVCFSISSRIFLIKIPIAIFKIPIEIISQQHNIISLAYDNILIEKFWLELKKPHIIVK